MPTSNDKKLTDNQSVYVWADNSDPQVNISPFELHINYWLLHKNPIIASDYLDFGVLLFDFEKIDTLRIFIPSSDLKITCISRSLFNKKVAKAIFNEQIELTHPENDKLVKISGLPSINETWVYETAENSDYKISEISSGILLEIDIKKIAANTAEKGNLYLRYRLTGDYINSLTITKKRGTILFESVHTSTRILDFRINQARSIDPTVKEIGTNVCRTFSKIHFFFIVPAEDELHSSSEDLKTSRNLEPALWDDYLTGSQKESPLNNNLYTVYHWKKKEKSKNEPVEDFSIYSKFKTADFGFRSAALYAGVAVLIAIFSNACFAGLSLLTEKYIFKTEITTSNPINSEINHENINKQKNNN